jgi:hypothetical protein
MHHTCNAAPMRTVPEGEQRSSAARRGKIAPMEGPE